MPPDPAGEDRRPGDEHQADERDGAVGAERRNERDHEGRGEDASDVVDDVVDREDAPAIPVGRATPGRSCRRGSSSTRRRDRRRSSRPGSSSRGGTARQPTQGDPTHHERAPRRSAPCSKRCSSLRSSRSPPGRRRRPRPTRLEYEPTPSAELSRNTTAATVRMIPCPIESIEIDGDRARSPEASAGAWTRRRSARRRPAGADGAGARQVPGWSTGPDRTRAGARARSHRATRGRRSRRPGPSRWRPRAARRGRSPPTVRASRRRSRASWRSADLRWARVVGRPPRPSRGRSG